MTVREKLRDATSTVHARLHRHPGLSAAAAGVIDVGGYRALLARLYGFHRPFEAATDAFAVMTQADAPRSRLLADDLEALGVPCERVERLPLCCALPSLTQDAQALGAHYVIEGSALGGARIARALAPLLAPFDGSGCRFFSNDGGQRRGWKDLLNRIEALGGIPCREQAAVEAAVETFRKFEDWMTGWAPDPP